MMVFKFIDHDGQTHFLECDEVTYLGTGDAGQERAWGVDGESPLNYDLGAIEGGPQADRRYFIVAPPIGKRVVLCAHMRGAWLLNDQGKTIENMMALEDPIPYAQAICRV